MPAAMLAGRGDAYRERLYALGWRMETGQRQVQTLHRYLSSTRDLLGRDLPRVLAASRIGWNGTVFVLPDRAIGGEEVVFQSAAAVRAAIREAGTLDQWREGVARPVAGNSRLVLSISAAFAATLLGPLGLDGSILHLRGPSSTGKTTALLVAGSVWGGGGLNGFRQSWEATANGLEAMAVAHSDILLALDELGLTSPETAARTAYQLASGTGRQRAQQDGSGANRLEWRAMVLSTGEICLADKLREGRQQRLMAGQAVRMIDLPADVGRGFGIFDHAPALSDKPDGGTRSDRGDALSRALTDAIQKHFGTAGPAFVEALIANRKDSLANARQIIATFSAGMATGADGQVQRVAQRFGLIAAAGELAIGYGVVPWPEGAAIDAARTCFGAWRTARGTDGPAEIEQAIAHLRATIERDGASRFQQIDNPQPVHRRLGYMRKCGEATEYLVLREMWGELMAGRDPKRIAHALAARGILKQDAEGRPNPKERIPGGGTTPQRVYVVRHDALFDDGDGTTENWDA